ncbi:MAG: hypothetical protein HeimC2_21170 [Candidatus Heimdallarchaeota archaeon LC_2]|nr:MAG: hypothetical protein HeimC2_21170 [Candidatus Heimdallarchaeota archaeon LC_2]
MSTTNLDDTNPLAFMLFVGAGSILGGILTQMLFPREDCPIPEKHTEDVKNKATETNSTETDEPTDKANQTETIQES